MRLVASGSGFGEKVFDGLSNILRVLVFETREAETTTDSVVVCNFEVDGPGRPRIWPWRSNG